MSNALVKLVAPLIPKALKSKPAAAPPDGLPPDRRDAVTEAFFEHRRKNPDQRPSTPIERRMQSGRA